MICTPYADPNAHGALSDTVIFIRRRGIIYCKAYAIPKDPRSAGQVTQRTDFKNATLAWNALSSESKDFYNSKAYGQSYTGYNYFIHLYLLGILPSTTPLATKDFTNAVIGNLRSTVFLGWEHFFESYPVAGQFCSINDNENAFDDENAYDPARNVKLVITRLNEDIAIQAGDTITIFLDGAITLTVYLPAVTANTTLYIADDGSTYYDINMLKLAYKAP